MNMISFKITKENNYSKSVFLKLRTHHTKAVKRVTSEFQVLTVPFTLTKKDY